MDVLASELDGVIQSKPCLAIIDHKESELKLNAVKMVKEGRRLKKKRLHDQVTTHRDRGFGLERRSVTLRQGAPTANGE